MSKKAWKILIIWSLCIVFSLLLVHSTFDKIVGVISGGLSMWWLCMVLTNEDKDLEEKSYAEN